VDCGPNEAISEPSFAVTGYYFSRERLIRSCVRVAKGEAVALKNVAQSLGGMSVMSTNIPAAVAGGADAITIETRSTRWAWIGTALAILLTTAAVLAVSFFAVVTNL
jgi:hypothetical protein